MRVWCKAFALAGLHSNSRLWESVACKPRDSGQMRRVLEWVVSREQHIRRPSLQTPREMELPQLLPLWGLMTSAFVTVRSLLRCGAMLGFAWQGL